MRDGDERPRPTQRNVLGQPLAECSRRPLTGFFRNGCCETDASDRGAHVVCVQVTADFLAFSKQRGNDLTTPVRSSVFPGCNPATAGVCAPRAGAKRWRRAWRRKWCSAGRTNAPWITFSSKT